MKYILLSLLTVLALSCNKSSTTKVGAEDYQDSLKKYFSESEINYIREYAKNYKKVADQEEFYRLFKNGNTLIYTLNKKMDEVARNLRQKKYRQLPAIGWFHKVIPSMKITRVFNDLAYKIIFDYNVLYEKTLETTGNADEEFLGLLKMCYGNDTHFPKWNKHTKENEVCSTIGSGTHKNILNYISEELGHSVLFKQEVINIEHNLIKDLFNAGKFCESTKDVIAELKEIKEMELLKQQEQKRLVEEKIQEIQKQMLGE